MREVFGRGGVPYLLTSSFVGRLPSSMAMLALVRLVIDSGGGYAYASTMAAAYIAGGMIGQPVLARVVDLTGRRRPVLIAAAATATVAFVIAALAVSSAPWLALGSAAVAGLATPPLESVLRSLWVVLFTDPTVRKSAYSVDAAVQELAFVLGPLLTAGGILLWGATGNVILMAGFGLVGALAFAAHPRTRRFFPVPVESDRHGSPLSDTPFRRLLIVVVTMATSVAALTITATAFGELAGAADLSSWAIALNGLGALVGAVLSARYPLTRSSARLVRPLGLVLATSYLPLALTSAPVWAWLAFATIAGVALPVLLTHVFALTPSVVAERHGNEANAWVISAFGVGSAVGTTLAGQLIQALGPERGIAAAVIACALIGVVGASQAGSRAFVAPRTDSSPRRFVPDDEDSRSSSSS